MFRLSHSRYGVTTPMSHPQSNSPCPVANVVVFRHSPSSVLSEFSTIAVAGCVERAYTWVVSHYCGVVGPTANAALPSGGRLLAMHRHPPRPSFVHTALLGALSWVGGSIRTLSQWSTPGARVVSLAGSIVIEMNSTDSDSLPGSGSRSRC